MPSLRELFLRHQAQTSPAPLLLEMERAEGLYIFDRKGKKYLDLISGIAVSNLGHRHPEVQQAVEEQLSRYWHLMVYGEFIQSPQVHLAEALSQTLPEHLNSTFFVNSGSEAVEGALKLAKRVTGRSQLISCRQAYHGSSHGALSVGGEEHFKQAFRPLLPGVRHIQYNTLEDLEMITDNTAAVIMETVQGEAGVRPPNLCYLQAVRERCNQTGALLILDEIQTGFGRTGTFWAFEQYGITPDILVTAKGMGGGLPLGAFIASREYMKLLTHDPILGHISTFGGHPVSCAASLATLKVIRRERLVEGVSEKEKLFHELLQHPEIREVRSKGLMMAVEFSDFDRLLEIIQRASEYGIITDWFLFCDNSLRIAPPLLISESEIREACQSLLQAIEDTKA